jgi:hypothetical protein
MIDIFKLVDLWGENSYDRLYNHFRKGYYHPYKIPFVKNLTNMLDDTDIQLYHHILNKYKKEKCIQKSLILSKIGSGHNSKRCSYYYNDFDVRDKQLLDEIGIKMIPKLESLVNKKLTLGSSDFRAVILVYSGKDSEFAWHYDTEHEKCYRTIILLHRKGPISKLKYIDENGNTITPPIENIGDGIIFRGTTTYHGIESTHDDSAERIVIGFQYIESNFVDDHISYCSEFRSKSLFELSKAIMPTILLFFIITRVSSILLEYKKITWNVDTIKLIYLIISLSYILPMYNPNINTITNLKIFIFLVTITLNINIALVTVLFINLKLLLK